MKQLSQDLFEVSQHWFREWLVTQWYQTITWANVSKDLRHNITSVGHNEITHWPDDVNTYMRTGSSVIELRKLLIPCSVPSHYLSECWFVINSLRQSDALVSKLNIIGPDNGLSPGQHQAIIWNNAGVLLIWTLGTNFNEILSKIHTFSFKKMHLKMSSVKWLQVCFCLNVL